MKHAAHTVTNPPEILPSALLISFKSIKKDPALKPNGRGARKLAVTRLIKGKEFPATNCTWAPPRKSSELCPVVPLKKTEIGVFNQYAHQDRHYHNTGTEIYEVIQGKMIIEIEGRSIRMETGDMVIINPGTIHKVIPGKSKFFCRAICLNCRGSKDKYTGK
jgi:mannose-6-phosphate isomerase-like protein (cupin superfamily)